jgi:hypothetical protein
VQGNIVKNSANNAGNQNPLFGSIGSHEIVGQFRSPQPEVGEEVAQLLSCSMNAMLSVSITWVLSLAYAES